MADKAIELEKELAFRSFTINPESVSLEFQEFIDFGIKESQVTPFDITVYEPERQREDRKYEVEELMEHGTKLLDACLYQYVSQKKRFVFAQNTPKPTIVNPSEIGEALFSVFHCLLTYNEIPPPSSKDQGNASTFICDIFKNPEPFDVYSKMIASFDLNLLHRNWLKRIKLYGIPLKIKHRLSLGVLNHGALDAFRIFKPSNFSDSYEDNMKEYREILKAANNGPSWSIFPGTSSDYEKKAYRSVESKLKEKIHALYSQIQIEKMANFGLLEPFDKRSIVGTSYNIYSYNNPIFNNTILDLPNDNILASKFTYPLYFHGSLDGNSTINPKAYIGFQK